MKKSLSVDFKPEIDRVLEIFVMQKIKTTPGMSKLEIENIEQLCGIRFPDDLRALYQTAVPVGEEFYDWTDASPENVWYLKKMIGDPARSSIFDVENCKCWMDEWGEKPADYDTRQAILMEHLSAAPKMIPIYKDYFLPAEPCDAGNPVYYFFQLCEAHCPGENLWLFFERVFANRRKELGNIDYDAIKKVPFWYETIGKCGIPVFDQTR